MNNKILIVIIAFLLGVIAYQSGVLDNFFHKGVKCNSEDAKRLGTQIISEKLLPKYLNIINKGLFDYKLEGVTFKNIVTKKYDKETGFHKCYADAYLTLKVNVNPKNVKLKDKMDLFFRLIFATDFAEKISPDTYLVKVPVIYTTEITDDKDKFFEYMKFDISQEKIYNNLLLLQNQLK